MLLNFSIVFGFILGALSLAAVEAFVLYWLLGSLRRRSATETPASLPSSLDGVEAPLSLPVSKEGTVWILEEAPTRGPKELKNKQGIIEVYPVKKHAKIKDQSLNLSDSNGCQASSIQLVDCTILTVSASDLPTRKWAKRYPIKLESKSSKVHNGSKACYIYLETSWEKESWCKALRLASCSDKDKLNWFAQLTKDFHKYLVSLSARDPSFLKPPTMLSDEATERSSMNDASSSRVRSFLRRISKKATKHGVERKASVSSSANGERKFFVRTRPLLDGSPKSYAEDNLSNNTTREVVQPDTHIIPDSVIGEGTLSWNLFLSRLCFDAVRNTKLNDAIKMRIQRSLSSMRTPSYIGAVTCTGLDLGSLPPIIHKIRVLPLDMNEAWTVEVDVEYSGGLVLDVETRVEICEPELEKDLINTSYSPSSAGDMTSDLLEGIEHYGNQLKSSNSFDITENKDNDGVEKMDDLKHAKSTKWTSGYASRWKAAVHSIANQVSQVPLSLAIRIESLRGTLRLHIKPPPSDQIWFTFTSMPDIEWNFESSIGERKITSTRVALFIGNRFKAAIRENMVLPNYENITIPWMLAEKDDWVARKVAPFLWAKEAVETTSVDSAFQTEEDKVKLDSSNGSSIASPHNDKVEVPKNDVSQQPSEQSSPGSIVSEGDMHELFLTNHSVRSYGSEELREPLLSITENQQSQGQIVESPKTSSSSSSSQEMGASEQDSMLSEEDPRPKRMGSRRKMLDIGKKMGERLGEKFEVQKRSIGEKGRSLVERMREKQHRDV